MPLIVLVVLIGSIIVMALLVSLTQKYFMNLAIKKFIIPKLLEKGFTLRTHKPFKLFEKKTGFKEKYTLLPFMKNGSLFMMYYFHIWYRQGDIEYKNACRVEVLFLFIKKVEFRDPL